MPKFLPLGIRGLQREGGSSRRNAVATAVESVGGRLGRFYFAFGDHDAFVIADLPDNESALTSRSPSVRRGARAYAPWCLTPEEVDAAVKRSVDFRTPVEWEEPRHM
jgi:hypothetical protein